jgi:hypothetical protein
VGLAPPVAVDEVATDTGEPAVQAASVTANAAAATAVMRYRALRTRPARADLPAVSLTRLASMGAR